MADYRSYIDCQQKVSEAFKDQERWTKMSILNVAHSGKFSSDRTIQEYCKEIWDVKPVQISIPPYNATTATSIKFSSRFESNGKAV
jgi:starch phosphorylase